MAASPSPLPAARVAVLDRVRRGDHSVNALALALGITDNAVRLHLAALVRDGLVWRRGVRHSGRAGQPAAEYGLAAAGEIALSAAYAPALTALVWALAHETDPGAARALYAAAGKRLAASTPARQSGSHAARAGACAARDARSPWPCGRTAPPVRSSSRCWRSIRASTSCSGASTASTASTASIRPAASC